MHRCMRSVPLSYERQRYIRSKSLRYKELPEKEQVEIRRLCREHGGEYCEALMEFVTTDAGATAVCARHYLSRSTLYRRVQMYYENFPIEL